MTLPRTLIDTREAFDAGLCGYSGPCDPLTDSEGLRVEFYPPVTSPFASPHTVSLIGPEGEVQLCGLPEIREVARSLAAVVAELTRAARHNPPEDLL